MSRRRKKTTGAPFRVSRLFPNAQNCIVSIPVKMLRSVFLLSCLVSSTMAQFGGQETQYTREELGTKPECFDDLDILDQWIATKEFLTEEFILCPNKKYKVGFPASDLIGFEDGAAPISLRQNTRILCGKDGKSSNNCVLFSGQFQVIASTPSFNREKKINIRLEGITFENGGNAGALLAAEGDVTFKDCVFRKHRNTGAISLLFFVHSGRRLEEIAAMEHGQQSGHLVNYYAQLLQDPEQLEALQEHNRALQTIEGSERRQLTTFDSCVFDFNTYGERTTATNWGVIGAETNSNDVVIKNCVFENNDFGDTDIVSESYAIDVKGGSTITMEDTCFINNDFVGLGVVNIEQQQDMLTFARNTGTDETDTACQFVSIGDGETIECIPYDTNSCTPKPDFVRTSGSPVTYFTSALAICMVWLLL